MGRLHSFLRRSACGPLCGPFQAVAKSLPRAELKTPLRANCEGRKLCRIKAGGRFCDHLPLTPPRNAGRERGLGGRFGPLLAVTGGRKQE